MTSNELDDKLQSRLQDLWEARTIAVTNLQDEIAKENWTAATDFILDVRQIEAEHTAVKQIWDAVKK